MHGELENVTKNMSYWKAEGSEPLKDLTIGQLVQLTAEKYPNREAISVLGGPKLTFGEVLNKVEILAAALVNLGLKKGDHVALWGFNTIEWYLSFLASSRAGLVTVNLNPLYQASELVGCLKQADVKALIMNEPVEDHNFYDILARAVPEIQEYDYNVHIASKEVSLLQTIIVMSRKPFKGTFKWNDLFSSVTNDEIMKIEENQMGQNSFDVCNLQFTSSHRVCIQTPFFHAYGSILGILGTIVSGCTLVLPHVKFSPNKSIDCIISEKCSVVYGTPTMYSDLLSVARARASADVDMYKKMASVELFHSGGAICLPHIIEELKKYFKNAQFMCGYGMTETSGTAFSTSVNDPYDLILSTVGRVTEHLEVKVIDNNGEVVPFGVAGELCCRGYSVMKGYYKDPVKTREVLDDEGWMRTGDKFILTTDGYGKIVARIKDIIIRGGENIAPKEVEELLIRHPQIMDVQVYGVNDSRLGEVVAAAVIKAPNSTLNEPEVKLHCKGQIASYKIPQYVMFVEKFPKTASGKIQKGELRKMTEKHFSI